VGGATTDLKSTPEGKTEHFDGRDEVRYGEGGNGMWKKTMDLFGGKKGKTVMNGRALERSEIDWKEGARKEATVRGGGHVDL